jgi:ABC-type transporter lipoprotein component MlaA
MVKLFALEPVINHYKGVIPDKAQGAILNAASNLSEPITTRGSLIQGYTKNAEAATKRLMINPTICLGIIQDKTTEMGTEARKEDLD